MPEAKFANLSIEDKAAQLIMIDIPDQQLGEKSAQHLRTHAWNGVILFAKNVKDHQQVDELIKDIHKNAKITPFMAVDQEGGLVDRFRYPEMSLSPGAMALGVANSENNVYKADDYADHKRNCLQLQIRVCGGNVDFGRVHCFYQLAAV